MNDRIPLLGANITGLAICYQHLSAQINRVIEPLKLNMTQMSILTHFSHLPPDSHETISHLAKVMEMNQPMVTKAIKAMTQKGWIERVVSEEDARISHLFMSSAGLQVLRNAQELALPVLENAMGDLNLDELRHLNTLLNKIKINI